MLPSRLMDTFGSSLCWTRRVNAKRTRFATLCMAGQVTVSKSGQFIAQ